MLIYLARHGQAGGTRYNELTPTGRRQADLLGKYLAWLGAPFDQSFTGSLDRQRETHARARAAAGEPSVIAEAEVLAGLDEISPDVWFALAEELRNDGTGFRGDFRAWIESLRKSTPVAPHAYERMLETILQFWIGGKYKTDTIESFEDFRARVLDAWNRVRQSDGERVLCISSGTPIALIIGDCLKMELRSSLELLRHIENTSLSVFQLQKTRLVPVSINSAPHLAFADATTLI
ncbi:MAG: histidine phosphatase family protein [Spirochaetales bacterium]|nr:histidine phosphatase family protein [Spirochaetales bacterium]